MTTHVLLRARPFWTAATALRRPETGGPFMRSIALGYLRTTVDCLDELLNRRAALVLEQTGNGPICRADPPCDVEPEPIA